MTRISLKEAYDNRDVIAWLVKHEDEINELMNILKDIDPSGDLTNVVTKTGDQTIDGIKTFIGKIVADCDIIQNGGNYETHAEQVFTTNDYIVMRDGAVSGLGTGQFSGFQVKKYDGADDGRLVIDSSGIARVGDVGDEQPLATRDEAADMTSGALVKWDNVNQKMIAPASNVGTDTKPIKIVNGEAVMVSGELSLNTMSNVVKDGVMINVQTDSTNVTSGSVKYYRFGKIVVVYLDIVFGTMAAWSGSKTIATGLPKPYLNGGPFCPVRDDASQASGWYTVSNAGDLSFTVRENAQTGNSSRASFMYITE